MGQIISLLLSPGILCMPDLSVPHSLPGSNIFRWSQLFRDVSIPRSWHPPVGGPAVVAKPLLVHYRLPVRFLLSVPYAFVNCRTAVLCNGDVILTAQYETAYILIVLGNLCIRPLQEAVLHSIPSLCSMPLSVLQALSLMCLIAVLLSWHCQLCDYVCLRLSGPLLIIDRISSPWTIILNSSSSLLQHPIPWFLWFKLHVTVCPPVMLIHCTHLACMSLYVVVVTVRPSIAHEAS